MSKTPHGLLCLIFGLASLMIVITSVNLSMFGWLEGFAVGFSLGGVFAYFLIRFMDLLDE